MPNKPEGLPAYGWESLLELADMATATMLKRHRREVPPGAKPVGCYWSGHDWVLLWRASEAVAMPPLSPGRQRLYDRNRTCGECGKKSLDPFELGRDGRRYCSPCQGPVHERLWWQERQRDRPVITEWARGVLADESVVLAAARSHQWYREVYVADLAGTVLFEAKVCYSAKADPDYLARHPEQFEGTVSPADVVDQLGALAQLRIVTWGPFSDLRDLAIMAGDGVDAGALTTGRSDYLGEWWNRWVGEVSGSYRFDPRLKHQPAPWEPVEQVARMRELLGVMADLPSGEAGALCPG